MSVLVHCPVEQGTVICADKRQRHEETGTIIDDHVKVLQFDGCWAFAIAGYASYGGPPTLAKAEGFISGKVPTAEFSVHDVVVRFVHRRPPPSLQVSLANKAPARAVDYNWSVSVDSSVIRGFYEWHQLEWVKELLRSNNADREFFSTLAGINDKEWNDPLPFYVIRAAAALEYVRYKEGSGVTHDRVEETSRMLWPTLHDFNYAIAEQTTRVQRALPDRHSAYMDELAATICAEYDAFISTQPGLREEYVRMGEALVSMIAYGVGDDGSRLARLYRFQVGSRSWFSGRTLAEDGIEDGRFRVWSSDITGSFTMVNYNLGWYSRCCWDYGSWKLILGSELGVRYWNAGGESWEASCEEFRSAKELRRLFRAGTHDRAFSTFIMNPLGDSMPIEEISAMIRTGIREAAAKEPGISPDSDWWRLNYASGITACVDSSESDGA